MKLLVKFKGQEIPLLVTSAPKEVLQTIIESKDDRIVYKSDTLYLDHDFKDIESINITFD